jgi:hypothetical protein
MILGSGGQAAAKQTRSLLRWRTGWDGFEAVAVEKATLISVTGAATSGIFNVSIALLATASL